MGVEERFITHLVLVMSNLVVVLDVYAIVIGFAAVVAVVPVAVDVPMWLLMLEVDVTIVVAMVKVSDLLLLFGQPLRMYYLYLPKALILYLFHLSSSLLYLDICLRLTLLCQDFLALWMKGWHSW